MLKTAEEYLKEKFPNADKLDWFKPVVSALNAARIEAIKECAERAGMIYWDGFHKTGKPTKYFQSGADNLQPDKQSILNLLNEVK